MLSSIARWRDAADAVARAHEATTASDAANARLLAHREWLMRAQAALPPRVKAARAVMRAGHRA